MELISVVLLSVQSDIDKLFRHSLSSSELGFEVRLFWYVKARTASIGLSDKIELALIFSVCEALFRNTVLNWDVILDISFSSKAQSIPLYTLD